MLEQTNFEIAGVARGGADQKSADSQGAPVSTANLPAASGVGGDQPWLDAQWKPVAPELIAELIEQWRRRQAWHRAEKSLTLQAKALCRRLVGGDKAEAERVYKAALGKGEHDLGEVAFGAIFPLHEAKTVIEGQRKAVEKRLERLAKELPVWPWVEGVRGVGPLSLAAIVGEAGDLRAYSGPAKLWKRMGLAVIQGKNQRRVTGDAALEHGYNAARRSVMWNIGACMIKAGGVYRGIYDERKAYESERVETKGHAHNRAQRYIEKRFARDLWVAWRRGGQ